MSKEFFEAGDYIEKVNGDKLYQLLAPAVFNSKFYIAHAKEVESGRECLLKFVDNKDSSYEINNLKREGNFQFYYPYIEEVYGNFLAKDPNGDEIFGVSVEFINGEELIKYRKHLEFEMDDEELEKNVFRQMLQFLYGMKYYTQFAHQKYLHRDIKPQNIMITSDGNVKIVDFDYAHVSGSDKTINSVGWNLPFSSGYSSPEIFVCNDLNKMPDLGTDVYAAGRVFFFWLNGVEYYSDNQTDIKYDPSTGNGIPSSALYCMNEELSYGIRYNWDRLKSRYKSEKYEKLIELMDRMCSSPESGMRYDSVDEIIDDMFEFLLDYFEGSYKVLSDELRLEEMPILRSQISTNDRRFLMVACASSDGKRVGKPLYEYSMRDIYLKDEKVVTIYNLNQQIHFYPQVEGIEIQRNSMEYLDAENKGEFMVFNKDVIIYKDMMVEFTIV